MKKMMIAVAFAVASVPMTFAAQTNPPANPPAKTAAKKHSKKATKKAAPKKEGSGTAPASK